MGVFNGFLLRASACSCAAACGNYLPAIAAALLRHSPRISFGTPCASRFVSAASASL